MFFLCVCLLSRSLSLVTCVHIIINYYYHYHYIFIFSLRGFLSIDIDVSGLYINQCDINNQFYSDGYNSNFQYNKFAFSQYHHPQQMNPQLFTHQIVPLKTSASFHMDNEIDALHDSHKCHRDSMDVCIITKLFQQI